MRRLFLALQFLTSFPIRHRYEFRNDDFPASLRWFPVAGILIGALQWSFARLGNLFHVPAEVLAVVVVAAGIIATGGLHLDGVADTADGFGAGLDRESILRIMKDQRLGVYGVTALVLIVVLKILAIKSVLLANHALILILTPAISRMSIACTCALMPYARPEGTGKLFAQATFLKHCLPALLLTSLFAFIMAGRRAWLLIGASILISAFLLVYSWRKIRGFTGDVLGLQNELLEISILFMS